MLTKQYKNIQINKTNTHIYMHPVHTGYGDEDVTRVKDTSFL